MPTVSITHQSFFLKKSSFTLNDAAKKANVKFYKKSVGAKINNEVVDMNYLVQKNIDIEFIQPSTPEGVLIL